MTLPKRYKRMPRKSVWLSPDEYNTLESLKSKYEASSGSTDWGKFLLLLAGVAIGVGLVKALSRDDCPVRRAASGRSPKPASVETSPEPGVEKD